MEEAREDVYGFNSLQTGTRIASHALYIPRIAGIGVSIPFKRERGSQEMKTRTIIALTNKVSIPFKRERGAQEQQQKVSQQLMPISFNSLQTGTRIASLTNLKVSQRTGGRFNSLQTGKRIARRPLATMSLTTKMFQFPSNGKAYRKQH